MRALRTAKSRPSNIESPKCATYGCWRPRGLPCRGCSQSPAVSAGWLRAAATCSGRSQTPLTRPLPRTGTLAEVACPGSSYNRAGAVLSAPRRHRVRLGSWPDAPITGVRGPPLCVSRQSPGRPTRRGGTFAPPDLVPGFGVPWRRMSKVPAFHTTSEEYSADHRSVYHDNSKCGYGAEIKPQHRSQEPAGHARCDRCGDLAEAQQ